MTTSIKRPSFQFYPGDWLEEIGLRSSSLAARGLWADLLCFMHQGEPYGHLRKAGRDLTAVDLARMVGAPAKMVERLLSELESRNVFSRTEAGTIYSRRQVRDEEIRNARREGGAEGGDKAFAHPAASRPGEKRGGGRQGGTEGGSIVTPTAAPLGTPPSSSSPFPSPSPTATEPETERAGEPPPTPATPSEARAVALAVVGGRDRPANPLVDRDALTRDGHRAITVIAAHEGLDPTEVLAKASRYKGHKAVRLDTMGDDYLAHTYNALRAWERRVTGKAEPEVPAHEEKPYVSPKAQTRRTGFMAEIQGGMRDERELGEGLRAPAGLPQGPRDGTGGA